MNTTNTTKYLWCSGKSRALFSCSKIKCFLISCPSILNRLLIKNSLPAFFIKICFVIAVQHCSIFCFLLPIFWILVYFLKQKAFDLSNIYVQLWNSTEKQRHTDYIGDRIESSRHIIRHTILSCCKQIAYGRNKKRVQLGCPLESKQSKLYPVSHHANDMNYVLYNFWIMASRHAGTNHTVVFIICAMKLRCTWHHYTSNQMLMGFHWLRGW